MLIVLTPRRRHTIFCLVQIQMSVYDSCLDLDQEIDEIYRFYLMNLNRPSPFYAIIALGVVDLDVRIHSTEENNNYEDKQFEKSDCVRIDDNQRDRKGHTSVISGHDELRISYMTILSITLWKHS